MQTDPDLRTRMAAHTGRQMWLDGEAEVDALVAAIAQTPALHLLTPGARRAPPLWHLALATGESRVIAAITQQIATLPADRRLLYAAPLPLDAIHPRDIPLATQTWETLFPSQDALSQSAWMGMARTAILAHNRPGVEWVLAAPAFWGLTPQRWADAAEVLMRLWIDPALRPTVIDALTPVLARIHAHPDGPDLRARHTPGMWAAACALHGWRLPTHSRAAPFAEIADRITTAHLALGFYHALSPWTDWVGLGDGQATLRLRAILSAKTG